MFFGCEHSFPNARIFSNQRADAPHLKQSSMISTLLRKHSLLLNPYGRNRLLDYDRMLSPEKDCEEIKFKLLADRSRDTFQVFYYIPYISWRL
jgi:hypothetical protein